ncbi:hypothetical protein [uncultured Tateyamaria sp.]|uniref:hypothetical protein n=1 Tax=uncultured Tateyamaria sp. TaxID=455651 RepID=UPI0026347F9B|nr:hypothetical protein [uncultured Tateyamaria sp.]
MNIIVPIHVEALRVTTNTAQQSKTALYQFDKLGKVATSADSGMIAAENFATSQTYLRNQPGIHLHWSIPRAYTKGLQDQETGALKYPVVPNRWIVIRTLKNNKPGSLPATDTHMWVLESDAHSLDDGEKTLEKSVAPWMDNAGALQGLQGNVLGRKLDATNGWHEPNGQMHTLAAKVGDGNHGYLGKLFQAPYGSGETFTAYMPSSGNILGIYDKLDDYFQNLPNWTVDADLSVSYTVMGWVNDISSDACHIILNNALTAYGALPERDKPTLAEYIEQVMGEDLKWSLSDYSSLTAASIPQTQAIMNGIVSGITWNTSSQSGVTYPTAPPKNQDIKVSVGSNTADALSAYLNGTVADPFFNPDAPEVDHQVEWLLNALQFDQLPKLDAGTKGVGQLQEFLHTTTFAGFPGGNVWSVRQDKDKTQSQGQGNNNEVTLPAYLGKLLAELNGAQIELDTGKDKIANERKQLFLDWSYHAGQLQTNVFGSANENLNTDVTGAFLVDGLLHYFPSLLDSGSYNSFTKPVAPYAAKLDSFKIALPADAHPDRASDIASYTFLEQLNPAAQTFGTALQEMLVDADAITEELLPLGIASLKEVAALVELASLVPAGSPTAQSQIADLVKQALVSLDTASMAIEKASTYGNALVDSEAGIDSLIAQATTAQNGIAALITDFKGYFSVHDVPEALPLAGGKAFTDKVQAEDVLTLFNYTADDKGFPGVETLLDSYNGYSGQSAFVIDTSKAAYYMACAHIYAIQSLVPFIVTCAYYLQFCLQELNEAYSDAEEMVTKLKAAKTALTLSTISDAITDLNTIATGTLPSIQSDLEAETPRLADALAKVTELLEIQNSGLPSDLSDLSGQNWLNVLEDMRAAKAIAFARMPAEQIVGILNQCLYGKVGKQFELVSAPGQMFASPNEPVILMAQDATEETVLEPFTRNGRAEVIPCRLPNELVAAATPPTFPPSITSIATSIVPAQAGMSTVFQQLAEEGVLLTPELSSPVSAADLKAAANANETLHMDKLKHVELNDAPTGLTGKLPYYVAYNWRDDKDPFMPLFIWWTATYTFSNAFDFADKKVGPDFLDQFELGQYQVEMHLKSSAAGNFSSTSGQSNHFGLQGVIAMSSNPTYVLCDQIAKYCATYLNYDPKVAPVQEPNDPDYDVKLLFHTSYMKYKSMRMLSQGLSGFNPSMIQRVQEMQLPVNIPTSWTDEGYPLSSFWQTQFLHNQSQGWPVNWNNEAPNPSALKTNDSYVDFNPLRAGVMKIDKIQLVDAFGRYIDLAEPNPAYVSDTMIDPELAKEIYLPPRLTQPTRVNMDWVAAETSAVTGSFVEPGSAQPAVSPICGWIWPNHLDNTLALYDARGIPVGSLGLQDTTNRDDGPVVHWFPVPGETTSVGVSNRDQMAAYLKDKSVNSVFIDVLSDFLFSDETKSTGQNFAEVLILLEESQSFIVTNSLQVDQDLSLFVGRPLVVAQAQIGLESKGTLNRAGDLSTFPTWNKNGPQFTISDASYIPYQQDNFNDGGISDLKVPTRIGTAQVKLPSGKSFPYFDDGVVGYFVGGDFGTLFTPVEMNATSKIKSLASSDSIYPVQITPNGDVETVTFIMDPRASVHATTGILPALGIKIPEDQFNDVLRQIEITFLTAPVLTRGDVPELPIPKEQGFDWGWVNTMAEYPIEGTQNFQQAKFPETPQSLVDGWLKLKRQ